MGSLPALLSRELVPIGVLHAADLEGPFHTLRFPRLSDMAARAFVTGKDVMLPKFPTPKAAEIGRRLCARLHVEPSIDAGETEAR